MNAILPAILIFTSITGMWKAVRHGDELEIHLLEDGETRAVQRLTVPIAALSGIAERQIESVRPAPVSFHLPSGDGTFGFHGSFMRSNGSGLYIYAPRPSFLHDTIVFFRAMSGGQVFPFPFLYDW